MSSPRRAADSARAKGSAHRAADPARAKGSVRRAVVPARAKGSVRRAVVPARAKGSVRRAVVPARAKGSPPIVPSPALPPPAVEALFDALSRARPNPQGELNFGSPFELLVAVILSAQATDRSVNQATAKLFPRHNTPSALLALGEAGLLNAIRTIGLAPTKARNIIRTCSLLLEQHGGRVPEEREALETLPGVGRKTANVVLNVAFGHPTIAVDTHVFRISNRTGLAPGRTVREVEDALMRVTPKRHLPGAHHQLILHGRYVCTARKPHCPECVIAAWCGWPDKTPASV